MTATAPEAPARIAALLGQAEDLAAQGHEAPKRRTTTGRSKRHSANDATPHDNGDNS